MLKGKIRAAKPVFRVVSLPLAGIWFCFLSALFALSQGVGVANPAPPRLFGEPVAAALLESVPGTNRLQPPLITTLKTNADVLASPARELSDAEVGLTNSPLAAQAIIYGAMDLLQGEVGLTNAPVAAQEDIGHLRARAEKGDARAQLALGSNYLLGWQVKMDFAEAARWVQKSAAQGNRDAQALLGWMYAKGHGVDRDFTEAAKWYRRAAEAGYAGAQFKLGALYASGQGVPKDETEALKWYRKAAEQNNADAQCILGTMCQSGEGVEKDFAKAAQWYRKAAEQNHAPAQFNLGNMYQSGEGVEEDYAEAVKWYRKAAEQNNAAAQFRLGFGMLSHGSWGIDFIKRSSSDREEVEGVEWIHEAAEAGLADAQLILGTIFWSGMVIGQDHQKALHYYRKAAEQGHAVAQSDLGGLYSNGEGVEKNYAEALKWYRKAAEQNYANAQCSLGLMYFNGEGMAKDYAEALKWYRKAAEQNNAGAQRNLGWMYFNGDGAEKDYVEGYAWINLASTRHEDAANSRALLELKMTPQQIAEAQKRTKELRAMIEARSKGPPPSDALFPRARASELTPRATGSGFFITDDGYLVTNQHVVEEGASFRVLTASGLLAARLVKVDRANDLAVLKVEGRCHALPVASSRAVKLGATVGTVGFPNTGLQGYAPKLAKGEIASLSGIQDNPRDFQISVPVQPGNSGGALVDTRGNVVGVVVAKLSARAALRATGALPENVNYAVKSSFLLSFLESLPEVAAKLKEPKAREMPFEDVVSAAEKSAVLVLVY